MSDSDSLPSPINPARLEGQRIRLAYLEGLRGLTSLYVVLFHVLQECMSGREISPLVLSTVKFIAYAEGAVSIFIVLSGYCLMLPVVQSGKYYIPGGVFNYLKRRSRRILPPYYAALILSLLLLALTLSWQSLTGFRWDTLSLAFQPGTIPSIGSIVSHFLLLQNLTPEWVYAINGPMWSMATEWQIYFIFPALLLPVYRYFGVLGMVVTAFAVGVGPHYIWPKWPEWTVCPWFLWLFALGMAGAVINFSAHPSITNWKNRLPWGVLSAIVWISVIVKVIPWPINVTVFGVSKSLSCMVGVAAVFLIIYCTNSLNRSEAKRLPGILQLLETPYAVKLGTFSFSLYLTHAPIVVLVHQFLLLLHLSSTVTFLAVIVVAVPLSLLLAYRFHLIFEQPFMSVRTPKKQLV